MSRSLKVAFRSQRAKALCRGVEWRLSFEQWMRIWECSGFLGQRGRLRGQYCMARNGDVGPYSVENVSIQPVSVNTSDGCKRGDSLARSKSRCLSAKGWTRIASGYQVMFGRKYIGTFGSEAAAKAAHLMAVESHFGALECK
jgi:hypothetical protein